MKKRMALLAGCLLLLMLAGCGGGEGTSSLSSGSTLADKGQSSLAEASSELDVMTVEETLDYMKALPPQKLGLEGESMAEYDIYHDQASIPVDGVPCMEITVYELNATSTNSPIATFLVARDKTAIYSLDLETDTITKLDV